MWQKEGETMEEMKVLTRVEEFPALKQELKEISASVPSDEIGTEAGVEMKILGTKPLSLEEMPVI